MSKPSGDYEQVERPHYGWGAKHDYAAIEATAISGQAVRVPLNGATPNGMRASIWSAMLRRGYRAHTRRAPGALIVWCERLREPSLRVLRESGRRVGA